MELKHCIEGNKKKTFLFFTNKEACKEYLNDVLPVLVNYEKYFKQNLFKSQFNMLSQMPLKEKLWIMKKCLATNVSFISNSPIKLKINGYHSLPFK